MATAGGKQAVFNAVVCLINQGDEVLIPKPYWVTFPEIVTFARGKSVFIETEENDFVLTADMVRQAMTPKTKLIILNSPSNPSGRVIPPEEFERILEIIAEHDAYAISDECYLRFVYPPNKVFSAASLQTGVAQATLYCGIVFKDVRDDRMAGRLFAGECGLDPRDAESAGTFHEQRDVDCASGGCAKPSTDRRIQLRPCSVNTPSAANGCSMR